MTSTINLSLPVRSIPWAMLKGEETTSSGCFTLGFDNGYIINNGQRYRISCNKGYEYIRKTSNGRRLSLNARALLALYLPDTNAE